MRKNRNSFNPKYQPSRKVKRGCLKYIICLKFTLFHPSSFKQLLPSAITYLHSGRCRKLSSANFKYSHRNEYNTRNERIIPSEYPVNPFIRILFPRSVSDDRFRNSVGVHTIIADLERGLVKRRYLHICCNRLFDFLSLVSAKRKGSKK